MNRNESNAWLLERSGAPVRHHETQRIERERALQTVALEYELEYDWQDPDCHPWFLSGGLPGYDWCVPKREVGRRLVRSARLEPTGYSYYLRNVR